MGLLNFLMISLISQKDWRVVIVFIANTFSFSICHIEAIAIQICDVYLNKDSLNQWNSNEKIPLLEWKNTLEWCRTYDGTPQDGQKDSEPMSFRIHSESERNKNKGPKDRRTEGLSNDHSPMSEKVKVGSKIQRNLLIPGAASPSSH